MEGVTTNHKEPHTPPFSHGILIQAESENWKTQTAVSKLTCLIKTYAVEAQEERKRPPFPKQQLQQQQQQQ